jgi:hypothetical protein
VVQISVVQDIVPVCPLSDRALVDKILLFIEEFSRASRPNRSDWYSYQKVFTRRIVESVLSNDGETITAIFSRQSGKTQCVADVAVGLAVILPVLTNLWPQDPRLQLFTAGFRVGIFAPIQETSQISFDRMRMLVNSEETAAILEDPEINVQLIRDRSDELKFDTGSEVRARSASPDSSIEGRTYHLVIIDEAQSVSRYKVEKDIRPMLAANNGSLVKVGTAGESRGGFHTDIQYNIAEYEAKRAPRNHFEFDYRAIMEEKRAAFKRTKDVIHLGYEKHINSTIKRLGGTDNEEFQMNYALKWAESRVIAFSERVLSDGRDESKILNEACSLGRQVAGLDVAKHSDATVLTIMQVSEQGMVDIAGLRTQHDEDGRWVNRTSRREEEHEQNIFYPKCIIGLLELQGSYEAQYAEILRFMRRFVVKTLVVDATGVGDPVYERLGALLPEVEVLPFKYSTPSKSDLYKYYLQEWGARRVRYAAVTDDPGSARLLANFEQQHADLDRLQSGIYITCQAPDGGHDDYPDSAALACYAEKVGRAAALPEIEVTYIGNRAAQKARAATDRPEVEAFSAASLAHSRAYRYEGRRRGR